MRYQPGFHAKGFKFPLLFAFAVSMTAIGSLSADPVKAEAFPLSKPAFPKAQNGQQRAKVSTAAFSPNGKLLILGMESGHVIIWDMEQLKYKTALPGHSQAVKFIRFGVGDRHALTGAAKEDLNVIFWDFQAKKAVLSFQGAPLRMLYNARLGPNNRYALSRGFDGFGVLWDLKNNKKLSDLFTYGFDFNPQGTRFATTPSRKPGAQIVRLRDQKEIGAIAHENRAMVSKVRFNPTGKILATVQAAQGPSEVVLWDMDTFKARRRIAVPTDSSTANDENTEPVWIGGIEFSPDGKQIFVGCSDGRILALDTDSGKELKTVRYPGNLNVESLQYIAGPSPAILAHATGPDFRVQSAFWKGSGLKPLWQIPGRAIVDKSCRVGVVVTPEGDVLFFNPQTPARAIQLRGFKNGSHWMSVKPTVWRPQQ